MWPGPSTTRRWSWPASLFVLLTIPMTRFTDWVARRQGAGLIGGGSVV